MATYKEITKNMTPDEIKRLNENLKGGIENRFRSKKSRKREENKRNQLEFNRIQDEYAQTPEKTKALQEEAHNLSEEERKKNELARERNKEEAMGDINTPVKGLTPQQRQMMQESANKQLAGQIQNYSKMLSGSQGFRGVRGGKAQADLNRQGLNAQTQIQRDLNLQDADLAMKRLAAYLSSLEGKQADELIRNQKYWDFVTGRQQTRKNDELGRYFNRYYGTV